MEDRSDRYDRPQQRRHDPDSRHYDYGDRDERDYYYESRHVGTRESPPRSDNRYYDRRMEGHLDHHRQRDYHDMYEDRPRHQDRSPRYDYEGNGDYEQPDPHERQTHRTRSRSPMRHPGEPSDTVVLEGVPYGPNTKDLHDGLMNSSVAHLFPECKVRLSASLFTRRAFVQFLTVDDATVFIQEHHPKMRLRLPDSSDSIPGGEIEVFLHYARGQPQDNHGMIKESWRCSQCHWTNYPDIDRCKHCGKAAPGQKFRPERQEGSSRFVEQMLRRAAGSGEQDVGSEPSQILVVYPLPKVVNEDMLEVEMKKLELDRPKAKTAPEQKLKSTAPSTNPTGYGARPDSIHRVFLVRDIRTNQSLNYGFVEFWTLEDAAAAMKKFEMASRFTVVASPATVGYIHMGVFTPIDHEPVVEESRLYFRPLFNPETHVRYRDDYLYVNSKIVTSEPPFDRTKPSASMDQNTKKRKTDGEDGHDAKKRPQMSSTLAFWQQRHDELHEGAKQTPQENDTGKSKIKISLSGSNRFGVPSADGSAEVAAIPATQQPAESSPVSQVAEAETESEADPEPVVHAERLMCMLCMLKFTSPTELTTHQGHQKHLAALKDPAKVKGAIEKTRASIKALKEKKVRGAATAREYRDRAMERRTAHVQPNKRPPKPAPQPSEGTPASSLPQEGKLMKGAGMLAKMGWKEGSGLGAKGDGRTEVVPTNKYKDGVGLGVEGANLGDAAKHAQKVIRADVSGSGYAAHVNDRARERFKNMK